MSYIRSGSNPEKLYIFGNGQNIEIYEGKKDVWCIPQNIFNGLIKKYHRIYEEFPCNYKGALLEEININGEFKIKLSYENNFVYMWFVTWAYIANHK